MIKDVVSGVSSSPRRPVNDADDVTTTNNNTNNDNDDNGISDTTPLLSSSNQQSSLSHRYSDNTDDTEDDDNDDEYECTATINSHAGAINGLSTSVGAASRMLASPFAGYLFGIGTDTAFSPLPWWAAGAVAVVGVIHLRNVRY